MTVAVDICGVQERHPEFEGAVDGGDGLVPVRRTVGLAHAHATQALRADLECSERAGGDTHADTSRWGVWPSPRLVDTGVCGLLICRGVVAVLHLEVHRGGFGRGFRRHLLANPDVTQGREELLLLVNVDVRLGRAD